MVILISKCFRGASKDVVHQVCDGSFVADNLKVKKSNVDWDTVL